MPENDQTRWMGIRPTNPAEDIPTTTRKLPPAISDLAAIYANADFYGMTGATNCTVKGSVGAGTCPAGVLYVVTNISARNETSMCDIVINARTRGANRPLRAFYSVAKNTWVSWDGMIVYNATEQAMAEFYLGGAADFLLCYMQGYIISLY